MKVLVTGANGFIGHHLVRYLADNGFTVAASSRNPLPGHKNIQWVGAPESINSKSDWSAQLENVESIIHLAGIAHRPQLDAGSNLALEMERVNVAGSIRLAEQASQRGIRHFVFVSSIAAVTSRSSGAVTDDTPAVPSSPYGRSKLAAEQGLRALAERSSLRVTILRPPVVFGSGQPANLDRLVRLLRSGFPLPFSALENRRSFLFVGNLCSLLAIILHQPPEVSRCLFAYDHGQVSTKELVLALGRRAHLPVRLFPCPNIIWQFLNRAWPDGPIAKLTGSLYIESQRLAEELHWTPPFSFADGIDQTSL